MVDPWNRLAKTPRTIDDMAAIAQAAEVLLPRSLVLRLSDRAVTFERRTGWFLAREQLVTGCLASEQIGAYALTSADAYFVGHAATTGQNRRDGDVAEEVTAEWRRPRYRQTRALLALWQCATLALHLTEGRRNALMDGVLHRTDRALCELAVARLDGAARTVAGALASDWPGSPSELAQTAKSIAAAER